MRLLPALLAAPLLLAACGRAPDAALPPPAPTAADAAGRVPTRAQVDAFLAEGPEPALRKLAVADYWLHYKMMQATGIERELGGEPQAAAALQALGDAFERKLRGAEADLPRLVPAAFTGEGMASGFLGLGMGSVAGMMTGGILGGAVARMSDRELAGLVGAGPIRFGGGGGDNELRLEADGALSQSMAFDVNEHGVNGKVKLKTRMDACPDASGKLTVTLQADAQMSVSGKPGTGGSVRSEFRYERWLDDDAHLIDSGHGGASELRIRVGGIEDFQNQHVEITTGYARDGTSIFRNHEESGYSIFRPGEVARTQALLQGAQALQTLIAEAMLRGMGGQSPWEGGRCVDLQVASNPGKRKGIRPGTTFALEAKPRARADGAPAGGTVTAILDGGASLQPASGKVPADAKFGYAGPKGNGEAAGIAFEARSKRGVGKARLEFDTRAIRAYTARGGLDDFQGTGTICDLGQPFTISGGGNTVTFTPSSEQGGSYRYQGNMRGIGVHGDGVYTATADDNGGTITASGNGCVRTPMGTHCSGGTERYTLTPTAPCD